jgi:membrane-associated phospholipid phosphatase
LTPTLGVRNFTLFISEPERGSKSLEKCYYRYGSGMSDRCDSREFTFEFTWNILIIFSLTFIVFISEKSKPKLWNVSWIKTLNHSSFLKTTISESTGQVVVKAVFTFISSNIWIFEFGKIFSSDVKYRYIVIFLAHSFDEYSFPSGHAFTAFLLTYILKKYSNIDISIIPYLVGFSRVYLGVHYPTDIIGGFLLSKIIIKLFLKD